MKGSNFIQGPLPFDLSNVQYTHIQNLFYINNLKNITLG